MIREGAQVMKKQKSSSNINISSMASQYGIPKVNAYTTSESVDPERKNKVLSRTPMSKLAEPSGIGETVFIALQTFQNSEQVQSFM